MGPRFPWRLFRMLWADLLRTMLFATIVLELLIAFAAAVKPLADGRIGPVDAAFLMTLALIPMLQFAVPFAAGFASTIVLYRFAGDNEARAAMAGGINHRQLIAPAVVIAVLLGAGVLLLADRAIPPFLRRMEMVLTHDVIRMVVSRVESGESLRFGRSGWEVYAESAISVGPDPEIGAFGRLALKGVLAVDHERAGEVSQFLYADQVHAFFRHTDQGAASVQLDFHNATGTTAGGDIDSGRLTTVGITIPSAFRDDPKFKSYAELFSILREPERFDKVGLSRHELVHAIRRIETMRAIHASLDQRESVLLRRGGDEQIVLRGRGLTHGEQGWSVQPPGVALLIEIETSFADGARRIQRARRVWIEPGTHTGAPVSGAVSLVIRMENVVTMDPEGRAADVEREGLVRSGILLVEAVRPELDDLSLDELTTEANRAIEGVETDEAEDIRARSRRLRDRVRNLEYEIISKMHERAALAVTCVLMVILGAVVGIRRGDALPLQVYMWGFFPATIATVTIGAGQQLTHDIGSTGLYLLWGGTLFLLVVLVIEYRQWRRH